MATFFLGLTFLCTQVNEYFKAGFAIHDGAFASVFYGLTGLHGAARLRRASPCWRS